MCSHSVVEWLGEVARSESMVGHRVEVSCSMEEEASFSSSWAFLIIIKGILIGSVHILSLVLVTLNIEH